MIFPIGEGGRCLRSIENTEEGGAPDAAAESLLVAKSKKME